MAGSANQWRHQHGVSSKTLALAKIIIINGGIINGVMVIEAWLINERNENQWDNVIMSINESAMWQSQ